MKASDKIRFKQFDWIALITTMIIAIFGLLVLYSVALGSADPQDMRNVQKQIIFIGTGMALYLGIALWLDYRILKKFAVPLYGLGTLLLAAVLFFGQTIRGTTGWFALPGFSFQPVELAKLIIIVFMAWYLTRNAKFIFQLRYLLLSALGVLIMIALVLAQPDFGSAVILFAVWFGLVIITGIKKSHLIAMVSSFAFGLVIMWFFVFQDFQRNRILVFLDPARDPLGTGYNVSQAIIAVGSGQLLGRGLGFGSQSQLKFLPESQTDFIFAVIGEELGLFGVTILLALFGLLFWRILTVARETRDNFGTFLTLGVLIVLFVQLFINIGMNVGLLPVTGITLPLVSYGGSSLIISMILLGLVQSVHLRRS